MDKPKIGINIPQQSLLYIGLCLIGVAIFLLGGILPASKTLAELDHQAAMAGFRLEEQKTLAPYQQMLKANEGKKGSDMLPMPERGKLPQAQINTIPLSLGNLAKTSGMSMVSAVPNLKAMTGDALLLPVNVVLRGSFADFRKFLIALGGLPYVEHIEEITIQEKPDAREYRLTLWVAIG
jgi:Tfp pilus assembly protein PilO